MLSRVKAGSELAVAPDEKMLPEVTVLSETSQSSVEFPMAQLDPEQTIMIGPVSGRYARESGLRLKTYIAAKRSFAYRDGICVGVSHKRS
jgi:hypothetical protein